MHSAPVLLADRMVRKLLAPLTQRDTVASSAPLVECAERSDPLPRGQQTGICAASMREEPRVSEAAPADETVSARVASLRRRFVLGRSPMRSAPAPCPRWALQIRQQCPRSGRTR
jgi:hypothetical protein